jgi:MoaA/NifB/PqqE/SkfB family radical SAM enzyme
VNILNDLSGAAQARILRRAGLPVRPRLITFNVTDRCNARCTVCDIHTRKPAGEEITAQEIKRLFSDPAMQRLDVLRITGGEPFLREDIHEIFNIAQAQTPVRIIYVTTNGLLPDRVESFARAVLPARTALHLQVSLDALDERHDTMRGVPGARDRALDSLNRLAALRREFDFHFGINQTVLAHNLNQIEPMHVLASSLGAGHSIILGARHHEGKDMTRAVMNGNPLPFDTQQPMAMDQIEEFYKIVSGIKGTLRFDGISEQPFSAFLRELSEAYLNEGGRNRLLNDKLSPAPPCMALFAHARILPHGDVVACSVLANQPIGNVRQKPFSRIWRSARARTVRGHVLQCPGCWVECDIQPSIFYSGDIVKWGVRQMLMNTREIMENNSK